MEPSLGVVNACLPVMQPALGEIFGPKAFRWLHTFTRSGGYKGSKGSNLMKAPSKNTYGSNDSNKKGFHALDSHSFVLEDRQCLTEIEGNCRSSDGVGRSVVSENAIETTIAWDVNSTAQKNSERMV